MGYFAGIDPDMCRARITSGWLGLGTRLGRVQMSGWDTSSRPTWGQPEGPDDDPTHLDPDPSASAGNPWDRPAAAPAGNSWDAPQADNGFGGFGDNALGGSGNGLSGNGGGTSEETAAGYPRRTPGRTLGQGLGQPGLGQPGSGAKPSFGQRGQELAGFGDLPR